MSRTIKQYASSEPLTFYAVNAVDHTTMGSGIVPTVYLSKNGGAFASPSGAIYEIGRGWYGVSGSIHDTNTLGPLILSGSGVNVDPFDKEFQIVGYDPRVDELSQTNLDNVAENILKYDWDGMTGEAARSMLNALRFLRNRWYISSNTLTVTKENDSTSAWTSVVSGLSTADPIVSSDPG